MEPFRNMPDDDHEPWTQRVLTALRQAPQDLREPAEHSGLAFGRRETAAATADTGDVEPPEE
ncbi:MAG: hypothetical protein LBR29_11165 [Methylobacteriaceae bacterium]|nr:hypothetical protein [Methylobacteriaceae bacterium]